MEFKPRSHLTAGFAGGLVSAVSLQPLDLLKTRMQQAPNSSLVEVLRSFDSPLALWRGTVPSALRTSIGAALYLTLLAQMRSAWASYRTFGLSAQINRSSDLPRLEMGANLAVGAFARGAVGLVTMPITVVKVRFESSSYAYKSMAEAVRAIWRERGVRAFFYGYGSTFVRDAPYAGLYVLFYEHGKDLLNSAFPAEKRRSNWAAAALNSSAAGGAAVLATTITAPFDTLKTRVQLYPTEFPSLLPAARKIIQNEGFRALFDGLGLRMLRKAVAAGVSWCIYEQLVRG